MDLKKAKENSVFSSTLEVKTTMDRPKRNELATAKLEDNLKKRHTTEQTISDSMSSQMDSMAHTAFNLGDCMHQLQRESAAVWASLNVNRKRLELRLTRPPSEAVHDCFQIALEQESSDLNQVHKKLTLEMKKCGDMLSQIESAKDAMHQNKLTLHLHRDSFPQKFLREKQELEDKADQFRAQSVRLIRRSEVIRDQSKAATTAAMNKRMSEVVKFRRHLEKEINDIRCSIDEAQHEMRRMKKVIRSKTEAAESKIKDGDDDGFDFDAFHARANDNGMDYDALANLRAKIKGAAYTGTKGRTLEVLFSRFDQDESGELDEDEVRRALRRTLKIPPTTITDAEISALCTVLDSDQSGSVSIKEMCEFLDADIDVNAVKEEYESISNTHSQLCELLDKLVDDLRLKAAAWKVDRSCSNLTAIKGLELDTLPPPIVPRGNRGGSMPAGGGRKPLEPRVLEKVRHRLKAAAQEEVECTNDKGSKGQLEADELNRAVREKLEEILSFYDKGSKGHLEADELRRAVRVKLKIPSYTVSDAEIASLCAKLDSSNNGCADIEEILAFVTESEEASRSSSKLEHVRGAEPDRGKKSRQPREAAGVQRPSSERSVSQQSGEQSSCPSRPASRPTGDQRGCTSNRPVSRPSSEQVRAHRGGTR